MVVFLQSRPHPTSLPLLLSSATLAPPLLQLIDARPGEPPIPTPGGTYLLTTIVPVYDHPGKIDLGDAVDYDTGSGATPTETDDDPDHPPSVLVAGISFPAVSG